MNERLPERSNEYERAEKIEKNTQDLHRSDHQRDSWELFRSTPPHHTEYKRL